MNFIDLIVTFAELHERFGVSSFSAAQAGAELEILQELVKREYLIYENDCYQIKFADDYARLEEEVCIA